MTDSNTIEKLVRVGARQVSSVVKRFDFFEIKDQLASLDNKGSSRAPMYSIDQVREILVLTDDEYNELHSLATKPRAPRTPKSDTTANTELLTLATDLAAKSSKIDSINSEITKLTNERDTLQNEVNAILSQLKLK